MSEDGESLTLKKKSRQGRVGGFMFVVEVWCCCLSLERREVGVGVL